jgi:hypothetical protein
MVEDESQVEQGGAATSYEMRRIGALLLQRL